MSSFLQAKDGIRNDKVTGFQTCALPISLGTWIEERRFPNRNTSLLAAGARLGIPVTVHVAIGTDIIHMHPAVDGAALGEGTLRDFRTFAAGGAGLGGGAYPDPGSAAVLPEGLPQALTPAP